jgi:hypothetical protein
MNQPPQMLRFWLEDRVCRTGDPIAKRTDLTAKLTIARRPLKDGLLGAHVVPLNVIRKKWALLTRSLLTKAV